ncbi:MAG TPA: response regulator [Methylomirabilota bacterium]|nr:response regulator [Methylomirabilota bacterium]
MAQNNDKLARILVADDDTAFRLVLARLLEQAGYECVVVADATEARERLSQQPFDLLVSDIQMPGNDGLELIQSLPQVAQGMPVILLTGHPTMQSAMKSVRLPVFAYLVKPPDPDELLELVAQCVANSRLYRAVAANRERLTEWLRDLDQIEQMLAANPAGKDTVPLDACVSVTLRNLLGAMTDMKRLAELVARRPDGGQSLQEAALLKALQDTIGVLEKTKQSFKSKELGELRKRLQVLVPKQP